jgi:hypothetical protein
LTTTRRPTAQPARRVGTYRQPVSRRGGTYAAGRPRTRGVTGTGKTGFPAGTRACLYCETYRQATRERDRAGASEESCRSSCDAGFCTTTCMVECEMKCMPKCETGQCEVSCMTSIEPERQK